MIFADHRGMLACTKADGAFSGSFVAFSLDQIRSHVQVFEPVMKE